MRVELSRFAVVLLATATSVVTAQVQTTSCVNDAPNPYRVVKGWTQTPRPLGATSSISVDTHDNVWVIDRCERACATSSLSPVWEFSPDGKMLKNFGAGLFALPHGLTVDRENNIWIADGGESLFRSSEGESGGKGVTVTKLSPDGKVLLTLGKPGVRGTGEDVFSSPTAVAVAPNGDVYVADGHRAGAQGKQQSFGNSRIVKFDKNGKFITAFGHFGTGDGELMAPHSLAFDAKQNRLFVADRSNSRIEIFDKDGKFVAVWKQFGRPSALFIDKNDTLYASDDQSQDVVPKDTTYSPPNPNCKRGMRIGSAKTGKVEYLIPQPHLDDPAVAPGLADRAADIEGVTVDSHGTIYGAGVEVKTVYKYVKN